MMHPDLTAALARQRMAEMSQDVDRLRARARPSRIPLRVAGRTHARAVGGSPRPSGLLALDRPSQPVRDDDGMTVTEQQPAGRRRVTDAKEIRAFAHPVAWPCSSCSAATVR